MSFSRTEYLIVRWTKDKSISMIHESDIVMKSPNATIAVDSKLSASYEGKVLDAIVLKCGDFDEMDSVFRGMQPNADRETDSPKGRGHRMPKRKVHPDFETEEVTSDEAYPPKKKRDVHRVSVAASGQDVIDQLLNDHHGSVFNVDHIDFDGEVQRLKDDLAAANQKIQVLERQNEFLRTKLPAVVAKLESYVNQLPSVCAPSVLPVTPTCHKVSTAKQQETFPQSETGLSDPPSPPKSNLPSPIRRPLTENTSENVAKDFEISPEILRRVSQTKGKGKLVCNLLRALFTRQELATSSLKGKGQKGERRVLDASKVEALTAYVLDCYPDADRSFVRLKITEKLNDERKAFFKTNRGGLT